ncbi:MAG: 3-hydroxyacyl-[acyl-carrier-protein] dehydratase FabZ [Gammaproteobacteria bacterium]|nr:MAG: 3-hydroxyacyl-[acyl-carrier-protein] dehydratase FabZ [Gammaproteobacteria bacterium]
MEIKSNIYDILKLLPHRYPFLMIDKITKIELGKSITAIKNITFNEPCFMGHFPEYPVFPGVLILEAMAQATGILSFKTTDKLPDDDEVYLFVGVDKARFKKQVIPGDQLIIDAEVLKTTRGVWKFAATASVDGKVACKADLMGTVSNRN